MSSKTSMVAADFRLQEWAAQIRECQSRPAGMSVVDWCASRGITKANYYYRLRRVREICLETIQGEIPVRQMVPVQTGLLQQQEQKSRNTHPGLDISIKGVCIHVTESTSMPLLAEVLKAVQHAQ
ncbi:MAG: IS66 family insertion sequence element accessory protein TnpB [Clostridiales bacterium]|nr:IS66 family insertion sequence element accessory protein TnpB [Clostridiales bacterium]